ncbi:MAG: tetratricopeptide repeat protein, partial [Candidatus Eisenbacteria bacterium]|nr:tetratricopeptide repeat protein [Candidatus Eisenbacteria bacterium]
ERLLRSCSGLRILATSRRALGLEGEYVVPLAPLPVPDPGASTMESIAHIETVRLFLDRAAQAEPSFRLRPEHVEDLADVCARLEGMPLAIELAASRIRMLSLAQIRERLTNLLPVLSRGRARTERHDSVRATLDWSYEQLAPEEQALMRRLSIFSGGCTLESAESVCVGGEGEPAEMLDLLTELVEVSLVETARSTSESGQAVRYRLLETVRQYAGERLALADEATDLRLRHRDHFAARCEGWSPMLRGPQVAAVLPEIEADHANLLAAVECGAEVPTNPDVILTLASTVGLFWDIRGFNATGRRALESLLEADHFQEETDGRAAVMGSAGVLALNQGDVPGARRWYARAREISRHSGDERAEARALHNLAICAYHEDDLTEARRLWECSLALARKLGFEQPIAITLNSLGVLAAQQEDHDAARAYYEESLELKRKLGNRRGVAVTLANLGQVVGHLDREAAITLLEESVALSRELGADANCAFALRQLGNLYRTGGELQKARPHIEEAHELVLRVGERLGEAESYRALGNLSLAEGRTVIALEQFQRGLEIALELGNRQEALTALGQVALAHEKAGNLSRAARLLGGIDTMQESFDERLVADSRKFTHSLFETIRGQASDESTAVALAEERTKGRALTYESLVAYALRPMASDGPSAPARDDVVSPSRRSDEFGSDETTRGTRGG